MSLRQRVRQEQRASCMGAQQCYVLYEHHGETRCCMLPLRHLGLHDGPRVEAVPGTEVQRVRTQEWLRGG